MIASGKTRRLATSLAAAGALASVVSCTSEPAGKSTGSPQRPSTTQRTGGDVPMSVNQSIVVTSAALKEGQPIPKEFTGEGQDVSPPLAWSQAPDGTNQWALICDDPDAPTDEPWVHWVLYGIGGSVRSLAEGIGPSPRLAEPKGALQGKNSWPDGENVGYRGPMPPKGHGVHHYHFRLYALDAELGLAPGLTKSELLKAIKGHVLATGELVGTYERR